MLAKVIESSGSTKGPDLIKALHDMPEYEGVTGPISFDEKGDRKTVNFVAVTVRDGKYTTYSK